MGRLVTRREPATRPDLPAAAGHAAKGEACARCGVGYGPLPNTGGLDGSGRVAT